MTQKIKALIKKNKVPQNTNQNFFRFLQLPAARKNITLKTTLENKAAGT